MNFRMRIFIGTWLLALALGSVAEGNGLTVAPGDDMGAAIVWLTAFALGVALLTPKRRRHN